jgi:hypothetical protein
MHATRRSGCEGAGTRAAANLQQHVKGVVVFAGVGGVELIQGKVVPRLPGGAVGLRCRCGGKPCAVAAGGTGKRKR